MQNVSFPSDFLTFPSVYAVGGDYKITVCFHSPALVSVKVGDEEFFDDSNGILRSARNTHIVSIPSKLLDREKSYTVRYRKIIERLPYFTKTEDVCECTFSFRPLDENKEEIRVYHVADAHNSVTGPVNAASFFGDTLDFLILNGDIPNHSGDVSFFDNIHLISGRVTHGEIPTVFSRGNHDLRGVHAEELEYYTPTQNGNSFYTFRLGPVWGIVLDCGEDKDDSNPEYGHTVVCHAFRKRETRFIRDIISNAKNEYEADGVKYRLIVCHVPFTYPQGDPFDIEKDVYSEWAALLKDHVRPDLMISGHLHEYLISMPGSETDALGHPCPLFIASQNDANNDAYAVGGGIILKNKTAELLFTDNDGNIRGKTTLPLN